MGDQLTTSAEGLRLFFTDDIYLIRGDENTVAAEQPVIASAEEPVSLPVIVTASEPVTVEAAPAAIIAVARTVVMPATAPEKEIAVPADFKYLGKNQKNVLILVHDTQNDVSTEKGRELLRNIVKALQLTANDFALLNYRTCENAQFAVLGTFFSSRLVLSFGVSPSQLGLDEQPKNAIVKQGAVQLVFSQNLDLLADDQDDKKALWGSLKQIQL